MAVTTQLLNEIRLAFKRANQRIVELGKQFGKKSNVLKNEIAWMEKGAVNQYTGVSGSGNKKFDISKITRDFKEGKLSQDELNEIMIKAAGQKVSNGELVGSGKGISTTIDIKERVPEAGADWKEQAEELAEIEQNFQTEYEEIKKERPAKQTLKQRTKKEASAMPTLYSKKKSYSDLKRAIEEMKEYRKQGKKINDKLKEG